MENKYKQIVYLPKDLVEKLRFLKDKTKLSLSAQAELAFEEWIKKHQNIIDAKEVIDNENKNCGV